MWVNESVRYMNKNFVRRSEQIYLIDLNSFRKKLEKIKYNKEYINFFEKLMNSKKVN